MLNGFISSNQKCSDVLKLLVILLIFVVILYIGGGCSQNKPTTTTTSDFGVFTFGQLAIEGENIHSNCLKCHSLGWVDSSLKATLADYQNARLLLSKIATMPIDSKLDQYQVLSYILIEQGWVSEDGIFDVDTLEEIMLNNTQ